MFQPIKDANPTAGADSLGIHAIGQDQRLLRNTVQTLDNGEVDAENGPQVLFGGVCAVVGASVIFSAWERVLRLISHPLKVVKMHNVHYCIIQEPRLTSLQETT